MRKKAVPCGLFFFPENILGSFSKEKYLVFLIPCIHLRIFVSSSATAVVNKQTSCIFLFSFWVLKFVSHAPVTLFTMIRTVYAVGWLLNIEQFWICCSL